MLAGWLVILVILAASCNRTQPPPPTFPPAGLADNVTYVADSESRIVHRSDCEHVAEIKKANRVSFKLLPDALAERYTPCKHCLARLRAANDKP